MGGFSYVLAGLLALAPILPNPSPAANTRSVQLASAPSGAADAAPQDARQRAVAAVLAASAAIERTKALRYLWRDTETWLRQAKKAGQAGDYARSVELAERARGEAELAENQAYLAKARYLMHKLAGRQLTEVQRHSVGAAREALRAHRGREAWDRIQAANLTQESP